MAALDAKIDGLYRLPLTEFTLARNALAKSLSGGDAARVRALAKPAVVPWAVNQVYWRARGAYERLMTSGEQLRAAQIAALEGREADVRAAGDAHRRAIANAVAEADRLAAAAGAKPGADALARTFEALSLVTQAPEPPGRLTGALQPAGFEALTGITPQPASLRAVGAGSGRTHGSAPTSAGGGAGSGRTRGSAPTSAGGGADPRVGPDARTKARDTAQGRRAAAEAARVAAEQKQRQAALKDAEAKVARAEAAERAAREVWERAHDALLDARRRLADVKSQHTSLKSEI